MGLTKKAMEAWVLDLCWENPDLEIDIWSARDAGFGDYMSLYQIGELLERMVVERKLIRGDLDEGIRYYHLPYDELQ